ncbi:MAG: tryptophan synthase subunit alpha [Gammaproteobacteria bacterium]|nr:tryptophan synthase subunit alpha [Gammaproteobacteria bacterium]
MTGRLADRFRVLKAGGRTALIPFITAGDPQPSITVPLMHALAEAGADIIELGVPFSDPMADGPVIQKASERALAHHMSLVGVLAMVREFRAEDPDTPVVLMGYLNPIEAMGYDRFAADANAAGVDGVLTVDLPPEEGEEIAATLSSHGIAPVFLIAPTSDSERIRRIVRLAGGFVYYASVRGVTGAANFDLSEVAQKLRLIRAQTHLPVGVGFGISSAEAAAKVAGVADAVIVGSALVGRIGALASQPGRVVAEAAAFIGQLRAAMDNATSSGNGAASEVRA